MENLGANLIDFFSKNAAIILSIGLIILLTGVTLRLIRIVQHKLELRLIEERVDSNRQARMKTLLRAATGTLNVVVLVIAIMMILIALGINITPLLASAGVAGLAVSLGAQTLIKDYIGGVIILFENQYNVGDDVQIGVVTGTVERIEMRASYIRDSQGKLFAVPNGDVRTLSNNSRDWSKALVDLNLPLEADIKLALTALSAALEKAKLDEGLKAISIEPPAIQGWNNMTDWAVQIRLSVKTQAGKQSDAAIILRRYALEALEQAGLSLAKPPGVYH